MPGIELFYGVATTIRIICKLVDVYTRHQVQVDEQLPQNIIDALKTLVAGCEALKELNKPGPQ